MVLVGFWRFGRGGGALIERLEWRKEVDTRGKNRWTNDEPSNDDEPFERPCRRGRDGSARPREKANFACPSGGGALIRPCVHDDALADRDDGARGRGSIALVDASRAHLYRGITVRCWPSQRQRGRKCHAVRGEH